MSRASALLIGATALSAASLAFGQSFMVNTPASLITCQPYNIQWTGGVAPFFPSITQPGEVSQIIEQFPQTNSQNFLWTVNQAAGQKVTIVIGDSQGMQALSGISPAIVAGTDTSCVGKPAAGGSGSSSGAASSGAASTSAASTTVATTSAASISSAAPTTTATTSSAAATTSATRSSTSSSSAAPSASSTTTPNSAAKVSDYSAMVAGLVGVVAAALI